MTQPTVRATDAGTFLISHGDDTVEVTPGQASHLADALAEATHAHAPQLVRVTHPDKPAVQGLRCPHCGHQQWQGEDSSGVLVEDRALRSSEFAFDVRDRYVRDTATGEWSTDPVPTPGIYGDYNDDGPDWEGVGYSCGACGAQVRLPDDVEEVGL